MGDFILDTGARATTPQQIAQTQRFQDALSDAAGYVEAAVFKGQRYSQADLIALTGNGASLLRRIICTLTYWFLYEGRHQAQEMPSGIQVAFNWLEQLASGALIFGEVEAAVAGLPMAGCTPGASVQARRYFGGSHGNCPTPLISNPGAVWNNVGGGAGTGDCGCGGGGHP